MWNAIGEALKIFLEKHLIPTAISFVISIITLIKLPKDYWMIEKVGKTLFFILVLLISFLAIELVVFLFQKIQEKRFYSHQKNLNVIESAKEEKQSVEELLSFVDKLPPEDRKLIKYFIRTGNSPKILTGHMGGNPDSIFHTNAVVSTETSNVTIYKLQDSFCFHIKRFMINKEEYLIFNKLRGVPFGR